MHLTSALNCSEKNTQTLLRVILVVVSFIIYLETLTQHEILNSMHLTSAVNCWEKNTQTLLIVNIALAVTQHSLRDFNAALDSKEHALDIRL